MADELDDVESKVMSSPSISSDRAPSEVEQQVCSVSARSTLEDLCAMVDAADWLLARARSIHCLSRQIAIEWIEHNGEFSIGNQHYSIAYNSTVRCLNLKDCGHQLLESAGGDFGDFLDVLVAQPYKSGNYHTRPCRN